MKNIKLISLAVLLVMAMIGCGKAQENTENAEKESETVVENQTTDNQKTEDSKTENQETEDAKSEEKVDFEKVENTQSGLQQTINEKQDGDYPVPEPEETETEYSHNTLIVMVKEGTKRDQVQAICDSYNLEIKYSYGSISGYALTSEKTLTDEELEGLIKSIKEYNFVTSVEKDYVMHLDGNPAE